VVWILAETPKGTSAGSGAIISPDGYILTAAHVIEGASRIKVVVEESREFWASVVNADYKADVAILKIPTSGLTWFALGDSDKVAIEEQIRVLGYPLPGAGVGLIAVAGGDPGHPGPRRGKAPSAQRFHRFGPLRRSRDQRPG